MTGAGPRGGVARFEPRNPAWEKKSSEIFERQSFMRMIGARIALLSPGACDIELPYREDLCQQNVYLHGGAITSIADTSCGIASSTLLSPEAGILSVEFKYNMMAPAAGERFIARGRVVKPGRTLTIAESAVFAVKDGVETEIGRMLATMIALEGKGAMQGAAA
ncbi:MAG: PaaI family thioesterase [Xanthobacteraceae bacterium]|nr:PaaI family thioesterase [Xanthobacteraceae bacterium]MBX3547975.1 PaaI family thioesterase [Xanthobacteraceae bacterium]MCW5676053.1 PaaI family thioesterase [Xanthobacteraceae bacterium]MCW5677506.1 PaaI family thioesterase [Xanthobacteraceae bacterium]